MPAEQARRQRTDGTPSRQDEVGAARREFVAGLRMLSTGFNNLVDNFTWAIGQRSTTHDLPDRVAGMIEFGGLYHQFGLSTVQGAISRQGGVSVDVIAGAEVEDFRVIPGLVVGLVDARYDDESEVFDGVALVPGIDRRAKLVAVGVRPDGSAFLHPKQYDPNSPDLLSERTVEEIFPPRHLGTGRNPRQ